MEYFPFTSQSYITLCMAWNYNIKKCQKLLRILFQRSRSAEITRQKQKFQIFDALNILLTSEFRILCISQFSKVKGMLCTCGILVLIQLYTCICLRLALCVINFYGLCKSVCIFIHMFMYWHTDLSKLILMERPASASITHSQLRESL